MNGTFFFMQRHSKYCILTGSSIIRRRRSGITNIRKSEGEGIKWWPRTEAQPLAAAAFMYGSCKVYHNNEDEI